MPPQDRKATSQPNLGATETPSAILASNSKAIAVMVAANSESARLGTGFFVGDHGLLLTNFHVVEGTTTVGIKLHGTEAAILITNVRGYDLDNDLAVLQVDGVDAQPVMLGDSDKVDAGQPVVVVGNPEGLEQTVSNGLVSAIREFNGRRLFQLSAPISAGSSGSPVFNDHGEVVGVVVSSIEAGQNLNFAVPINYVEPVNKALKSWAADSFRC
jgi:S1-C subfamily serine protease